MYKNKRRRKILLGGLLCLLLIMMVGYAAFYSQLQISGTSNVTSLWDVEITSIEKDKTSGNVEEKIEPTYTKDSATFAVGLEKPGDYIYYKIGVTNKGTVAAIATLGNLTCTEGNAIQCGAYPDSSVNTNIGESTNLEKSRLIIDSGETEYYNVWIKYNENVSIQPDITSIDLKLTLTYKQSDVGITKYSEDKCYTGKVLENGTLTITDYDAKCGSEIIIPEEIDGYTVTEIQDGRWDQAAGQNVGPFVNKGLTSVVIPDTVTYIGQCSFMRNSITYLKLGNSVTTIKNEAFMGNQISSLEIPASVKNISVCAFNGNNLTNIVIPSTVTNLDAGAFSNNSVTGDDAYIYARNSDGTIDNTKLNSYAGSTINGVAVPENVVTIDSYAFRNVRANNIEIPSSVKYINGSAFNGCWAKSLKLNEGLISIGYLSFYGNIITTLNIPNSVTTIENRAFDRCLLKEVTIGSGIKSIGTNAFQYTELTSGTIYNPITSITINRAQNTVSGSPWGASKASINWTGTN